MMNTVAGTGGKSAISRSRRIKNGGIPSLRTSLLNQYQAVRQFSRTICETLVAEDYVIQTMPEASPAKWHLAHTSWFFETFVLEKFFPDYESLHPQYGFLFNSYYNALGPFYSRPHRGLLSRPTVKEVFQYRSYID